MGLCRVQWCVHRYQVASLPTTNPVPCLSVMARAAGQASAPAPAPAPDTPLPPAGPVVGRRGLRWHPPIRTPSPPPPRRRATTGSCRCTSWRYADPPPPTPRLSCRCTPPARTRQCWSRQTPAWTRSVHLDAPGQRHGQRPISRTADLRSSQTGQVIRGLR